MKLTPHMRRIFPAPLKQREFLRIVNADGVQTVSALTNVAAGNRESAMVNGSGRLANAVDSLTIGGIPFAASMDSAELLVRNYNILSQADPEIGWSVEDISKVTGTQVDAEVMQVQTTTPASESLRKVWTQVSGTNGTYTFAIKVKRGGVSDQTGYITIVNASSDTIKAQTNFTATGEWQKISVTGTTDGGTAGIRFNIYGDNATDILYKDPVPVLSSVDHASFPANSNALTTYATDLLSQASVVYTGDDFIVIAFMPYGWDDVDNPANATPLIFEAGALQVTLDASGFYTTNGGAVSTKKPVADTLSVMYLHFDGVNHTISVDKETPVVNASAIVPTGTTYSGNLAAGTEPAHAILVPFVGPGTQAATEISIWNDGLQNLAGSIILK